MRNGLSDAFSVDTAFETNQVFVREEQVSVPSDMIAFGDCGMKPGQDTPDWPATWLYGDPLLDNNLAAASSHYAANATSSYAFLVYGLAPNTPMRRNIQRRHDLRWNIAFCDGHVENLRPQNLFDMSKSYLAQRWNRDNKPQSPPQ